MSDTLLIFGGSGSLGNALIQDFFDTDTKIVNYSRDENKHWQMELKYGKERVTHVIGDIRSRLKIRQTLLRYQPTKIIIAAALKHIERAEFETNECIQTNLVGTQNILSEIEDLRHLLQLKTVCFVSTDKACSPVNTYGMCKAVAEAMVVEKARFIPSIKFVVVRYGNVLNTRGSIIPILHNKGKDSRVEKFFLTHERMTRFVMTLEQSVALIKYAMEEGVSGEIIIPKLKAMRIKDMLSIFGELYDKPVEEVGIRPGEKMLEDLINETQAYRAEDKGPFYHIRPSFSPEPLNETTFVYNSSQELMSVEELKVYLGDLGLL